MSTVFKYKIYCTTEAAYVTGWGLVAPTLCYNNTSHSVNSSSVQLLETISSNQVSIKEDKIDIGRTVKIFDGTIDAAPSTTGTDTFIFPTTVSFYSFQFVTDSTNKGDDFSIYANEDTVLGLITADAAIGATVINAPMALILYGFVGYHLKLSDGTNTDDLGMITAIDKVNNTVTVHIPTVHAFLSTNTLVKMTVKVLDSIRIGGAGLHKFCEDIIGGTTVPKGTVVNLYYTNNATTGDNKTLTLYMTTLC